MEALFAWYERHGRDFPWRHTDDPWAILVSEVMSQQTQIERVAARYNSFLTRFPTPRAMASAAPADVLAEWSGLGYNRRALNLQAAARVVAESGWPDTATGLGALPGVGPYTAFRGCLLRVWQTGTRDRYELEARSVSMGRPGPDGIRAV